MLCRHRNGLLVFSMGGLVETFDHLLCSSYRHCQDQIQHVLAHMHTRAHTRRRWMGAVSGVAANNAGMRSGEPTWCL